MRSRYMVIPKSTEFNEEQNDYFPDIMQFPINDFTTTKAPTPHILKQSEIYRFDLFIASWYGKHDYVDFIIWYNNFEYISRIEAGTIIYLPEKRDINNFYKKYLVLHNNGRN